MLEWYRGVDCVVFKVIGEGIFEWSGIIQWCEGYFGFYEEFFQGEVSCYVL